MLHLSLMLLYASIFDRGYSCPRPVLKSKEYELKILEDFNGTHSSDVDHIKYINKVQDEINRLKKECHGFKGVSSQCWDTSYICRSKGYISGCPCWTYEMEYENATTARLKFNKFYQNGVNVTDEDTILEVCDYVSPPWPFYLIYADNAGLIEFSHCVRDWHIECFCSSAQHSNKLNKTHVSGEESEESAHGLFRHLDKCTNDNEYHHYNCSGVIDEVEYCSCWNYNISYIENAITNNSFVANDSVYLNSFKINIVICSKNYIICGDKSHVHGCPCWEYAYEIEEQSDSNITYRTHGIKTRFVESRVDRNEINRNELENNELDLSFQKACKNANEEFSYLSEDFFVPSYTHCYRDGQINCYCEALISGSLYVTVDCGIGKVRVNGLCVDQIVTDD